MTFHLLFEQSGTFKNVLKEQGFIAYDYDILNNYFQTDFQIDLFQEIENEFENLINKKYNKTIFTNMTAENDFIIAFFPCTHFSGLNQFQYKLLIAGKKRDLDKKAVCRLIKRNNERARYFDLFLKFCFICKSKGIKTIIENPASCSGNHSYLELFSPINVSYFEKDRSLFGDNFKKPTNYFAINFDMKENFIFYDRNYNLKNVLKDANGMSSRSEITPLYALNFYKRFIKNNL